MPHSFLINGENVTSKGFKLNSNLSFNAIEVEFFLRPGNNAIIIIINIIFFNITNQSLNSSYLFDQFILFLRFAFSHALQIPFELKTILGLVSAYKFYKI